MRQKFAFRDGREPVKRTATCLLRSGFRTSRTFAKCARGGNRSANCNGQDFGAQDMLSASFRSILGLLLVFGPNFSLVGPTGPEGVLDQAIRPQALHALAEGPPELKPLSNSPINIKMVNDSKIVY